MIELITLDEVKEYLRILEPDEDQTIQLLINAASEAVRDVVAVPINEPVPDRVKLAIMTHVARAWCQREDSADLPPSAARLHLSASPAGYLTWPRVRSFTWTSCAAGRASRGMNVSRLMAVSNRTAR